MSCQCVEQVLWYRNSNEQGFSLRWSINSLQEITLKRDHLSPSVICSRSYSIKGHNWNQKPRWMPRDFPKHKNVSLLYRNIHIIKLFLVRSSQFIVALYKLNISIIDDELFTNKYNSHNNSVIALAKFYCLPRRESYCSPNLMPPSFSRNETWSEVWA